MTDIGPTPSIGTNTVQFNRVTTGIKRVAGPKWRVWIQYSHTDHGDTKQEMSRLRFETATEAERAATEIGEGLREQLG